MNIYVGNLPVAITEHALRELCVPYGVVERVNLVTDRATSRQRGVGFVEMVDAGAARAAIAGLNGKDLAGRALTVSEARPREDRPGPRVGVRAPRW